MTTRIQLRRDTAIRWTSINPVLAAGEPAVESDTGKLKVGDGTSVWSALPYILDVSDLAPVIEDLVAAAVPAPYSDEQVRDVVGATVVGDGDFIAVTASDGGNSIRVEPGAALTEVANAVSGRLSEDALRAAFGASEFAHVPVLRTDAASLPKWATAVAAVGAGTRDAKILMVGDSTTIGIYGNGDASVPDYGSPAATAVAALDRSHLPTVSGLGIPPSSVTNTDLRWSAGTGWAKTGLGPVGFGGKSCAYQADDAASPLVYADPRIFADTFDVYVVGNPGLLGSVQVTATGGSPVTANCGAAPFAPSVGIFKVTVTAAAAAWTNTVSITSLGGGPTFVVGVEPYLASGPTRRVRIGNAGASGSESSSWTSTALGTYGGIAAISAYAPDLTVISLQINDAAGGLAVATHRGQIQSLVTAAQASGDVLLVSPNPSQNVEASSLEGQYTADEKATFTSCGYVDLLAACGSWTRHNGLGYVHDDLHPNAKGYEFAGRLLADVIRRIV